MINLLGLKANQKAFAMDRFEACQLFEQTLRIKNTDIVNFYVCQEGVSDHDL